MIRAHLSRWALVAGALGLLACTTVTRLADSLLGATPSPTPRPSQTATPRATATHASGPSDAELGELQEQVVTLRGLRPTGPLGQTLLTPAELEQQVAEEFLGDYTEEDAINDARVLALFDLAERDLDLTSLYNDLYSEQIAGYYDPKVEEMYIVAGAGWTGVERLTYVHEFTHALQDQVYDLEQGLDYSEEACTEANERCLVISALIEGDATLLEEQWLRTYSSEQDIDDLVAFLDGFDTPAFDASPSFFQKDFLFPYEQGLEFVRAMYLKDGWAGVDEVYRRLPESSEQILHPALYPRATPIPVDLGEGPLTPGEGWKELERGVVGEWYMRLMLETRLEAEEAAQAAAGWGGDAYIALRSDTADAEALVLLTVWDQARDANEFVTGMTKHAADRFGQTTATGGGSWTWQDGRVLLVRAYTQTLWILAPDAETADALRRSIRFPITP
ncbi:MAG TPA: hypothetical protein VFI11_08125 [Anaerolineales bacterium]|nr:hypothetical protein [Anaerolineales bacterium]